MGEAPAALERLWDLRTPPDRLDALAGEIGSDVAFFLSPPAAWCTGRGEIVTPVPLGRRLDLVLVCPAVGLSTASVFRSSIAPRALPSAAAVIDSAKKAKIGNRYSGAPNLGASSSHRLR